LKSPEAATMKNAILFTSILIGLLGAATPAVATPMTGESVVILSGCGLPPQTLAGGFLTSTGKSFRVLTVPMPQGLCLKAETQQTSYDLRLVRVSVESGLALYEAIATGSSAGGPRPAAIASDRIETLSRISENHLIPWLDRAWEILVASEQKILPGTPILDSSGRFSALISDQWNGSLDPTRHIAIPADYIERWSALLNEGKISPGASLSSKWMREAVPVPQGYKSGLKLDPRATSLDPDPMGVTGELVAAADRSPYAQRAEEIMSLIERKKLLGLFVHRHGLWLQAFPRTYLEIIQVLADDEDVFAVRQDSSLIDSAESLKWSRFEIRALKMTERLRALGLTEAGYLADQLRILPLLVSTAGANIVLHKELMALRGTLWTSVWSDLRQRSASDAGALDVLLDEMIAASGTTP
jgi:hypothetical protein